MFKEYHEVSQEKSGYRRLFTDADFDLYVWYKHCGGEIIGLQLVELSGAESQRVLTWEKGKGSFYSGVLNKGHNNPTPVLIVNGAFNQQDIYRRFCSIDESVPIEIKSLVRQIIQDHRD